MAHDSRPVQKLVKLAVQVSLLRVVLTAVGPAAAGTAVASSRICPGEV